MKVAGIPSTRIVLLGQSLGTAVVSGVAERYTAQNTEFAGIVLVAGFSDLASMLSQYRIGGVIPVLAPFKVIPVLLRALRKCVVDKWHSADRLAGIVQNTQGRLRLSLVHAINDGDIPWTEDNILFKAAVMPKVMSTVDNANDDKSFQSWKDGITVRKGKKGFVTTFKAEPDIVVRQELFPYGGKSVTKLVLTRFLTTVLTHWSRT